MRFIKQYSPIELATLLTQSITSGPIPGFNAPPAYVTEAEQGQEQETALYNASAQDYATHLRTKAQPIIEADFEEID